MACAAASALRTSSRAAFRSSIQSGQKSIKGTVVDTRDLLFFLRNVRILTSFAFASARSCALVMLGSGVCFQR